MTDKQKLKSLKNKMKRIKDGNTHIDFEKASTYFYQIEKYHALKREHFFLEFEINHCKTCGKKL